MIPRRKLPPRPAPRGDLRHRVSRSLEVFAVLPTVAALASLGCGKKNVDVHPDPAPVVANAPKTSPSSGPGTQLPEDLETTSDVPLVVPSVTPPHKKPSVVPKPHVPKMAGVMMPVGLPPGRS